MQIQPRKNAEDGADHTAPIHQHDLGDTDHVWTRDII